MEAIQSGYASVSRALQSESLKATERAELIAVPLLLIVLLLVFRSLMAAAIPLAFGALTVFAGRGVLVLLDSVMTIEALSVVVCTMMGLALGVDYSLFIVSRFREELARGASPWEAARTTRRTAGRTTLFAGATLFTSILLSVVPAARVAAPLAGDSARRRHPDKRRDRLARPARAARAARRADQRGRDRAARPGQAGAPVSPPRPTAALRRPALAAILIAVPLALLAAPALAFNTGAPGSQRAAQLEPRPPQRRRDRSRRRPGLGGPLRDRRRGPAADRSRRRTGSPCSAARNTVSSPGPGVRAVIGPAPIQRAVRPLRGLGRRLASERARRRRAALRPGPEPAARGSRGRAAAGGNRARRRRQRPARRGLGTGRRGSRPARRRHSNAQPRRGARASDALERLATGSARLAGGQRKASSAGLALEVELHALLPSLRSKALRRARRLANELEAAARSDPTLRGMAQQERLLARILAAERDKVRTMRDVAIELHGALERLAEGGTRLEQGTQRLSGSASGLKGGLEQLAGGAHRLAEGLAALSGGAGALEEGLANGFHRSYPLQRGLGRASVRVSAATKPLTRGSIELQRRSRISSTRVTSSSRPSTERRRFPAPWRARRSTWGRAARQRGCS